MNPSFLSKMMLCSNQHFRVRVMFTISKWTWKAKQEISIKCLTTLTRERQCWLEQSFHGSQATHFHVSVWLSLKEKHQPISFQVTLFSSGARDVSGISVPLYLLHSYLFCLPSYTSLVPQINVLLQFSFQCKLSLKVKTSTQKWKVSLDLVSFRHCQFSLGNAVECSI